MPVNGAFGQNQSVVDAKWQEVTDKMTYVTMQSPQMVPIINRGKWNALPADLKPVMLDTAKQVCDDATVVWSSEVETIYRKTILTARPDYKFNEITADQKTQWRDAAKPVWDHFVQLAGPTGSQIIDIANATRSEFTK